MEVSLEEVKRIHALAGQQKTEFGFDHYEILPENKMAVYLKGIIQNDEEFKLPPEAQTQNNATLQVPLPSEETLADPSSKMSIERRNLHETQVVYMYDHVEYRDDGIYLFFKGMKYPAKGFLYPAAVASNGIAKRMLISQIRLLSRNPIALLPLIRTKNLEQFLHEYWTSANVVLSPYFLKDKFYCLPVKEIRKFVEVFLMTLGVNETDAKETAKTVGHHIEYDQAYRYRVEDLATVVTQDELLNNPRQAFHKIIQALADRDPDRPHLTRKFKMVIDLLSLALWIPKYRRAYQTAIKAIDFTKIQMDEADRYHTLRMKGYNFGGRTIEDRIQEYIKIHDGKLPQGYTVQVN